MIFNAISSSVVSAIPASSPLVLRKRNPVRTGYQAGRVMNYSQCRDGVGDGFRALLGRGCDMTAVAERADERKGARLAKAEAPMSP
jgi:hypothetical protein